MKYRDRAIEAVVRIKKDQKPRVERKNRSTSQPKWNKIKERNGQDSLSLMRTSILQGR